MKPELRIDFEDVSEMRKVMEEYGDLDQMVFGENEEGESTQISISHDSIQMTTLQNNGWIRVSFLSYEGIHESWFEGRWR